MSSRFCVAGFITAARLFLNLSQNSLGALFNRDVGNLPQLLTTSRFSFIDENSQEGYSVSIKETAHDWVKDATRNWMGELPDSTSLAQISIPGTHDSAARYGIAWCKTQSRSFTEQLEGGIRYFDIRNRRTGTSFALHHGPCFQHIMFGDVLNQMRDFFKRQPGEVILMRIKEEHDPIEGSKSFAEIWDRYMERYGSLFLKAVSEIPSLGEARGKIVVLRNAEFSGYGFQFPNPKKENPLADIQDRYRVYHLVSFGGDSVSISQKSHLVKEFINNASDSSKLVLNHLSGAAVGTTPKRVAIDVNPDIYDYIGEHTGKRRLGVLIMDYPGDKLVYRIIKSNFDPARRFLRAENVAHRE